MPVEVLKPHEQVIQKKVDQLERMTIRWDAYTKPLLVDGATVHWFLQQAMGNNTTDNFENNLFYTFLYCDI